MSEKRPQVLSMRTNGVPSSPANQHEPLKGKGSGGNHSGRSGRGRGSSEKHNEASRSSNGNDAPKPAKPKPQNEGEKLVVRRLPPGMTQAEFLTILGSTWETGKGKVDWFSYRPGKVSNDPSKPSRPARAYLHLMKKDDIPALSDVVRGSTWEDAKATFTNPSLIGPPSLEFSIYKKIPSNKKRTDTRQGTIDQDPEFMAFLEELANPVPIKESIDADLDDDAAKTETKVTTTPLVEYLKEKKANKGKDGKDGKNSKHGRQEPGAAKGKGGSKDDEGTKKRGKTEKGEKAEKPTKETVKILTKKAATEQSPADAAKTTPAPANANNTSEAPKSRRAGIAAAARILQRDLGLSPGSAHRRARQDAAKAEADTKTPSTKEATKPATERSASPAPASESALQQIKNNSTTSAAQKGQASGRRNRGAKNTDKVTEKSKTAEAPATSTSTAANPPVILKKKNDSGSSRTPADSQTPQEPSTGKATSNAPAASKNTGAKSGSNQKKSAAVSPEAVRGFVKHANPSQGITEPLLRQALEAFGNITSLEVDKRKGFAYVDFADHKSLVKAISSSPITVAQGTVQVLERKDKKPTATPAATAPATGSAGSGNGNTAAPEKSGSNRGRRGRGGGKGGGGGGQANAQPAAAAAASAPAAANAG